MSRLTVYSVNRYLLTLFDKHRGRPDFLETDPQNYENTDKQRLKSLTNERKFTGRNLPG